MAFCSFCLYSRLFLMGVSHGTTAWVYVCTRMYVKWNRNMKYKWKVFIIPMKYYEYNFPPSISQAIYRFFSVKLWSNSYNLMKTPLRIINFGGWWLCPKLHDLINSLSFVMMKRALHFLLIEHLYTSVVLYRQLGPNVYPCNTATSFPDCFRYHFTVKNVLL